MSLFSKQQKFVPFEDGSSSSHPHTSSPDPSTRPPPSSSLSSSSPPPSFTPSSYVFNETAFFSLKDKIKTMEAKLFDAEERLGNMRAEKEKEKEMEGEGEGGRKGTGGTQMGASEEEERRKSSLYSVGSGAVELNESSSRSASSSLSSSSLHDRDLSPYLSVSPSPSHSSLPFRVSTVPSLTCELPRCYRTAAQEGAARCCRCYKRLCFVHLKEGKGGRAYCFIHKPFDWERAMKRALFFCVSEEAMNEEDRKEERMIESKRERQRQLSKSQQKIRATFATANYKQT